MRQAIACALVATPALACITTNRMFTKTAYASPRHVACEQGKSTAMRAANCSSGMLVAVNCAAPDAEQAAQAMVTPCEAEETAGGESRRVAAARKKAATYSDEPDMKEAMDSIHKDRCLEAMRDELASLTRMEVTSSVLYQWVPQL